MMELTKNDNVDLQPFEDETEAEAIQELQKAMRQIENLKSSSTLNDEENQEEQSESEEKSQDDHSANQVNTNDELEENELKEEEKKGKKEEKLWKVKKGLYKERAEKEALAKENEHLKQMLNDSLTSGTYHYSKNVYGDLEKAKENKKRAIENGDADALIEADIAITKALSVIDEIDKWAIQDKNNNYQATNSYLDQPSTEDNSEIYYDIAQDWLGNHEYLNPQSKKYNSELAGAVASYVEQLDHALVVNNQTQEYFSDSYFQAIDNYIDSFKNSNNSQRVTKAGAPSYVGAVRNSQVSSINGKKADPMRITLSNDEKKIVANLIALGEIGSEKQYIEKYKITELKNGSKI